MHMASPSEIVVPPPSQPDQPDKPVEQVEQEPKQETTGFDCEFIEQPSKGVQSECPICLHILREPYQATCCGYSFCRACINRVKMANMSCPTCNEEGFEIFLNKGLQRSLYEFKVHCTQRKGGCEWTGELGELGKHLNEQPNEDKQVQGCSYAWITCVYCPLVLQRCYVTNHQQNHCSKRPFSCEYCNDFSSDFEDVNENHWPVCPLLVVDCPNTCGVQVPRQDVPSHADECPLVPLDCEFSMFGCVVKIARKDMPEHLQSNIVQHMSLIARSHVKLTFEHTSLKLEHTNMKLELENRDKIIEELREKTSEQENRIDDLCELSIPPVKFNIHDFSRFRDENNVWRSPPFYTHPHGYKLCLHAYEEQGRLATYFYLMKGEYDNDLPFPFCPIFTLVVISDVFSNNFKITFGSSDNPRLSNTAHSRVMFRKKATMGIGGCINITVADYLVNGCVTLEVISIVQQK